MNDELASALAHERRRELLTALLETDSVRPASVLDGGGNPRRLRAELHHVHLPKLEAAALVRWHRDSNRVRRGPRFDDVESMLAMLVEDGERIDAD